MQIQVKSVCSRISTSKESVIQQIDIVKISTNYEKQGQSVARMQIKRVTERTERLLIPPVYSLRGIRAYDELQTFVAAEVEQVKQTVTVAHNTLFNL